MSDRLSLVAAIVGWLSVLVVGLGAIFKVSEVLTAGVVLLLVCLVMIFIEIGIVCVEEHRK